MKAKEFVLSKYPSAKSYCTCSPYNFGMKHKHTVIKFTNDIGIVVNLSEGKSESNAWVNAKKVIQEIK